MQEMRANIYGRDPKTGFALKPQDNVGLQYGLAALQSGAISVEEFLDLNEKIGGNDVDGNSIVFIDVDGESRPRVRRRGTDGVAEERQEWAKERHGPIQIRNSNGNVIERSV